MIPSMMRRSLPIVTIMLAGAAIAAGRASAPRQAAGPVSPDARWHQATDAWEAGNYPEALEALRTLMQSSAATDYFERVALLTGELYVTTPLTLDGRNPQISPSGQFASYEAGPAANAVTRIVRLTPSPETVAELPTTMIAFDRAGRQVAWLRSVGQGDPSQTEIVLHDLTSATERVVLGAGLQKTSLAWSGDGESLLFIGGDPADASRSDVYRVKEAAAPVVLTDQPGHKTGVLVDPRGAALVYMTASGSPFAGRGGGRGGGGRGGRGGAAGATYAVVNLSDKSARTFTGTAVTMSADGSTLAWLTRDGETTSLSVAPTLSGQAKVIRSGRERMEAPALSPDGETVAYQLMTNTDWEIYVSDMAGNHARLTRDIQHDLLPRFLTSTTVLGLIGEARHRRAHLYDLKAGTRTRLFANNTVRTISPEYVWLPSADGTKIVIQAERDGDTVSPERDVSVVDLTRKISLADLRARIDRQLADEVDLRQRMTKAFEPVADLTRQVVGRAAVNRVYEYEKTLFDFDSKYITQPGNLKAIEYLDATYRSFGYTPEIQWFTPSPLQASGGRTANVVATLKGTQNPDLIYVVSSHFDSVNVGPGADDDTSGTAALLEAARILAPTPLPATVVFASFTGEEGGLLGSREFVRRAAEAKWKIVGALNNDMIGWGSESGRMDNTIRYSNPGIRDVQHGAAFLFTRLILYDAKYYKGTDAAAFYEGWGDIVGGLGSYPVLANPNYHQTTDFIETMNFPQIMETAKVTAATIVYLASSPSRLKDLAATRGASGTNVTWTASPEVGVARYVVAYGPETNPLKTRVTVTMNRVTLPVLPAGTHVAVKAVNARGLEGWDWARAVLQ